MEWEMPLDEAPREERSLNSALTKIHKQKQLRATAFLSVSTAFMSVMMDEYQVITRKASYACLKPKPRREVIPLPVLGQYCTCWRLLVSCWTAVDFIVYTNCTHSTIFDKLLPTLYSNIQILTPAVHTASDRKRQEDGATSVSWCYWPGSIFWKPKILCIAYGLFLVLYYWQPTFGSITPCRASKNYWINVFLSYRYDGQMLSKCGNIHCCYSEIEFLGGHCAVCSVFLMGSDGLRKVCEPRRPKRLLGGLYPGLGIHNLFVWDFVAKSNPTFVWSSNPN